jgi:WD40 repeat protein
MVASASHDGTARLWSPSTGLELATLRGGTGALAGLAFSPDGRRLATASYDGQAVTIWDAENAQNPLTMWGHTSGVRRVAISPDGQRLASASDDRTVKIWDRTTGQMLLTLRGHAGGVADLAFSPEGKLLATSSFDQTVRLWDAASGQAVRVLRGFRGWVTSVAFSPDGQRLASGSGINQPEGKSDWEVKIWLVNSEQEIAFPAHQDFITSVAFSPDGRRLITACGDKTAKVWDTRTGQNLLTCSGQTDGLNKARFSPDGGRLATAGEDGTAKVWDAANGQELFTLGSHSREVTSVAFSHDGQRLATASNDQTVKLWDAATGQELLSLRGHRGNILDVEFSPDHEWLASAGSDDRSVRVWEATPLTPERRLQREAGLVVNYRAFELALKDEMIFQLRRDPTLSNPLLRKQVLVLAERHRDDPYWLNHAANRIVKQPGQDTAKYHLALRQVEAALKLAPPEYSFYGHEGHDRPRTVLGIAQYRLGNNREALASLKRAQDEHEAILKSSPSQLSFPDLREWPPWNYAVMAMAHYELGEKGQARILLNRAQEIMKSTSWNSVSAAQDFLREAKALIEGPAAEPKKGNGRKFQTCLRGLPRSG